MQAKNLEADVHTQNANDFLSLLNVAPFTPVTLSSILCTLKLYSTTQIGYPNHILCSIRPRPVRQTQNKNVLSSSSRTGYDQHWLDILMHSTTFPLTNRLIFVFIPFHGVASPHGNWGSPMLSGAVKYVGYKVVDRRNQKCSFTSVTECNCHSSILVDT